MEASRGRTAAKVLRSRCTTMSMLRKVTAGISAVAQWPALGRVAARSAKGKGFSVDGLCHDGPCRCKDGFHRIKAHMENKEWWQKVEGGVACSRRQRDFCD